MHQKSEGLQNFISSYWQGNQPLWKAFWLIGIGLAVFTRLFTYLASDKHLPLIWWIAMTIILIPIQIWWMVSVWKCAKNTDKKAWSMLAKIVVLFSGIGMLGHIARIVA